jgi:ornithine carbamoyltransferase
MAKPARATTARAPRTLRLRTKDLLTIDALDATELQNLLKLAADLKARPGAYAQRLAGKSVVLLFEKPSLRTRVSFEVGVHRLGGHAFFYDHSAERIGSREALKDYARNLERFVHAIVARVYEQSVLEGMATHTRAPIINALSNTHHPCQALADALTIAERFGSVKGRRIAYIGDGNNVCTSLAQAVCTLGGHMIVISPKGYVLPRNVLDQCRELAGASAGSLTTTNTPGAVEGCDVVYTDSWVSMHHTDAEARYRHLRPYQVNAALMAKAAKGAIFMHCLPAERGDEVTDEVIDGPASAVYDQAENRLHAQNALLLGLLA